MNSSREQSRTIQVDNLSVGYEDYGQGNQTVIFIHGFPFDKSSWAPQLDFLKSSYRVIAYDIRGFNKSTPGDIKASIDQFAVDLIGLMDALSVKKAVICGLSMGGYIALNAIQHYPDRFNGIVLCDTQSIADTDEGKEKRYKTIEEVENNGLENFTEEYIKKIFAGVTLQNKPEVVEDIKSTILSTPIPTIARTISALAQRIETSSILKEIKVPALILCGSEDKVTPPEQAEFMHGQIKNSEYHLIPGAAHMSNLEQPEIFNSHLKNFLEKLS